MWFEYNARKFLERERMVPHHVIDIISLSVFSLSFPSLTAPSISWTSSSLYIPYHKTSHTPYFIFNILNSIIIIFENIILFMILYTWILYVQDIYSIINKSFILCSLVHGWNSLYLYLHHNLWLHHLLLLLQVITIQLLYPNQNYYCIIICYIEITIFDCISIYHYVTIVNKSPSSLFLTTSPYFTHQTFLLLSVDSQNYDCIYLLFQHPSKDQTLTLVVISYQ